MGAATATSHRPSAISPHVAVPPSAVIRSRMSSSPRPVPLPESEAGPMAGSLTTVIANEDRQRTSMTTSPPGAWRNASVNPLPLPTRGCAQFLSCPTARNWAQPRVGSGKGRVGELRRDVRRRLDSLADGRESRGSVAYESEYCRVCPDQRDRRRRRAIGGGGHDRGGPLRGRPQRRRRPGRRPARRPGPRPPRRGRRRRRSPSTAPTASTCCGTPPRTSSPRRSSR